MYGIPCDVKRITEIANNNQIILIEDCAHALGSKYNSTFVGLFGDFAFFSFNFDKPLSMGEGGMLVINNVSFIDKVSKLKNHYCLQTLGEEFRIVYALVLQSILTNNEVYKSYLPITFAKLLINNYPEFYELLKKLLNTSLNEYTITKKIIDYLTKNNLLPQNDNELNKLLPKLYKNSNITDDGNLLMNSVRSYLGSMNLKMLNKINLKRKINTQLIEKYLDDKLYKRPIVNAHSDIVYTRYSVLNKTKYTVEKIWQIMKKEQVEIRNYNWKKPIHLIRYNDKRILFNKKELIESESISQQLLNIPTHYYITERDIIKIVTSLNNLS